MNGVHFLCYVAALWFLTDRRHQTLAKGAGRSRGASGSGWSCSALQKEGLRKWCFSHTLAGRVGTQGPGPRGGGFIGSFSPRSSQEGLLARWLGEHADGSRYGVWSDLCPFCPDVSLPRGTGYSVTPASGGRPGPLAQPRGGEGGGWLNPVH